MIPSILWLMFKIQCFSFSATIPSWQATKPDPNKPLGGFTQIPDTKNIQLYHGNPTFGAYSHAVMIGFHNGQFLVTWKNGPTNEDKSGQRILYSQSKDGSIWTPANDSTVLFPNMTTKDREAALFVGPPIVINGRQYVGASPGKPTGAAQGAQFCLWPDPLNPRNCGPPGHKQANGTLLMRRVLDGFHSFGPIFWVAEVVPKDWKTASKELGFKTILEMDLITQFDISQLGPTSKETPCGDKNSGTLKCEACPGGCQIWDSIPIETQPSIGNERSYYQIPVKESTKTDASDVILYRSGKVGFLYASLRNASNQKSWLPPVLTNIPNDESNLNCGSLPDGRIFLLNNPVLRPKYLNSEKLRFRDPITIATSSDGFIFDKALAVVSCTTLGSNSTCQPRYTGGGKNPGPSYPQGLTVVDPAPVEQQGFYVAYSNNKEDIWVTKMSFSTL